MKVTVKILGVLASLFLAIGFVLSEARSYVPDGALPTMALTVTALAVWAAVVLIRRILRARNTSPPGAR